MVSPAANADLTRDDWLATHSEHDSWAADRWLAARAAAFMADCYGFGWSVLEELRAQPESTDPSRVQLWREHFDAAFECLPPERRATALAFFTRRRSVVTAAGKGAQS